MPGFVIAHNILLPSYFGGSYTVEIFMYPLKNVQKEMRNYKTVLEKF